MAVTEGTTHSNGMAGQPPRPLWEASQRRIQEALGLRQKISLFWGGKWIILVFLVAAMASALAYLAVTRPVYEASSWVSVEASRGPSLQLALGNPFTSAYRSIYNEVWYIQNSSAIAEQVADRLLSMPSNPQTGRPLEIVEGSEGVRLNHEALANRVSGSIRVTAAPQNVNAFRITVSGFVPSEAALVANLFAEEYVGRTRDNSRAEFSASRAFLEEQEARLMLELRTREDQIAAYMSQRGAVALDEETSRTIEQVSALEAQRDGARIDLEMKRAALRSMEEELAQIEPKLVQSVAAGTLRDLESVQRQISELEQRIDLIYERNPEFKVTPPRQGELPQLEDRLTALRSRANTLSAEYVRQILDVGGINPSEGGGLAQVAERRRQVAMQRIEVSGLAGKAQALEQRLAGYQTRLRGIPNQSMQLAQLERSRTTAEQLYVFIAQRLQEVRIAEQSELGYARIVRPASTPGAPVSPNRNRVLLLSLLLGLGAGMGLVWFRKRMDTRVRHPDDLKSHGLAVLSVIPDLPEEVSKQKYVELDGRKVSSRLTMLLHPGSTEAEAWRQIRAGIQFARPDVDARVVLVTSANPGEGKTTVAANLAIAMAAAGKRTLLVDADFRKPRVHHVLGLHREPGLAELMVGMYDLAGNGFKSGIDYLSVIPVGRPVPSPAEMLGSKKMKDLTSVFRESFDFVVFDTPPVLPFTEAQLLAASCDGVIVVAEAGKTDLRAVEEAVRKMEAAGAPVLGIALNRFDPKESTMYGYKYGYGYDYAYRHKYAEHYAAGEDDGKGVAGGIAKAAAERIKARGRR